MQPANFGLFLLLLVLGVEPGSAEEPDDGAGASVPYRGYSSAIALSNQQVLIVGGRDLEWEPTRQAEIFDVAARRFRPAGTTCYFYYLPTLLPLNDGRVLAAGPHFEPDSCTGRSDVYSPEIFDPDTNTWSLLGDIKLDNTESVYANRLYDGSILLLAMSVDRLFGSRRKDTQMYRAWLYDSDLGTVESITPPLSPRTQAFPAILPSGDVLMTGGNSAVFEPEHLCEQVPAEYAIEAGEPSGDWCAANGQWFSVAATTTETWDIFWKELEVHDQLPFAGATNLFTQVLESGDVLVVTRVEQNRASQLPRSAAVWSMETEEWSRLDDFPEYFHLDLNNDLVELDDGFLIGPSGGYSPASGEWKPFSQSLMPRWTVDLPSGAVGFLRTSRPYWTVRDPASAEWIGTAE